MEPHQIQPTSSLGAKCSERSVAASVALIFIGAGFAWVVVTDSLLYLLTTDAVLIGRLETAKGWLFIALAGIFLYFVTLRSAAKLARARRTIAAIIESLGDGILLIGRDHTVTHANEAALKMLRVGSADELLGVHLAELGRRFRATRPDGTPLVPEEHVMRRAALTGGRYRHKAVLRPQGADEVVVITTASAVLDDPEGQPELIVGIIHDVTELERLERSRNELVEVAAHSLKTPVTILRTNAELLLRLRDDTRVQRSAEAIERQCSRLERLTENLVVLARLRAGTLRLYPVELDLGALVQRVSRDMSSAWSGHEVQTQLAAATAKVSADPERLSLALRDVLDDALRGSEEGHAVKVAVQPHDGQIEVGITYEPRPEVERTAASRYDDLGLRRHIAQSVVEAHGGTFREETKGQARTIWLALPARS